MRALRYTADRETTVRSTGVTRAHDSGPGAGNRPGPDAGTAAEEAAVLARIRDGDAAAFRSLIDRHVGTLARGGAAHAREPRATPTTSFRRRWSASGIMPARWNWALAASDHGCAEL